MRIVEVYLRWEFREDLCPVQKEIQELKDNLFYWIKLPYPIYLWVVHGHHLINVDEEFSLYELVHVPYLLCGVTDERFLHIKFHSVNHLKGLDSEIILTDSATFLSKMNFLRELFFWPVYPSDWDRRGASIFDPSKSLCQLFDQTYLVVFLAPRIEMNMNLLRFTVQRDNLR